MLLRKIQGQLTKDKQKILKNIKPYRTRDPLCCFGMTRNIKMGAESTIWMVDPSGRSTNGCRTICCFCLVRRHNLLIWACLQNQQMGAVPFVVSVHNLLIWACLQNQHSVQLTHFVDGTDMCNG